MLKRTVVFGDAEIIDEFRNYCRQMGRIPSAVIMELICKFMGRAKPVRRRRAKKA